jgi:hypothetical protein
MIDHAVSSSLAIRAVRGSHAQTGKPLTSTNIGREGGARTRDPGIMSPLL